MQQRIVDLDVAKGLGIILIVLGHSWITMHEKGELYRVIFSFHLPLFFFLSGTLLRESVPFRRLVGSRAHSLLKPYVVVLTSFSVARILLGVASTGDIPPQALRNFGGIAYGTGATLEWLYVPMWFLPHLFLALCLALMVLKWLHSSASRWAYVILATVIGIHLLGPYSPPHAAEAAVTGWPWSADLLPISSAFLLLGYLTRSSAQSITLNPRLFGLAAAAFASLHFFFDETIDLNLRQYGSPLVATAQACLGIYLCLNVAASLGRFAHVRRILAYIGSGTLFILMFHAYIQAKAFLMASTFFSEPLFPVLCGLAAGVVLPLALLELVRRSRTASRFLLPPPAPR